MLGPTRPDPVHTITVRIATYPGSPLPSVAPLPHLDLVSARALHRNGQNNMWYLIEFAFAGRARLNRAEALNFLMAQLHSGTMALHLSAEVRLT